MNFTIGHWQRILWWCKGVKRPKPAILVACAAGLALVAPSAAVAPGAPVLEFRIDGFSADDYRVGVNRLVAAFEAGRGEELRPGGHGKVALKVYTNSGPGLSTPVALVEAVADALVERGFSRRDIILLDLNRNRLRRCGFLPDRGKGERTFEGHPVQVLESGEHYDAEWFYESPLPPRRGSVAGSVRRGLTLEPGEEDRKSYLPRTLLLEVDFWINLPVFSDHPALGLNGALVNATLWNASNTHRFFQSEASGPAAAAEMAAIPELAEGWLFSIASRERYQYVGGPSFHSLYTASEPVLMLGADPVALDARMQRLISRQREAKGFQPLEEHLPLLDYASQLKLGRTEPKVRQVTEEEMVRAEQQER